MHNNIVAGDSLQLKNGVTLSIQERQRGVELCVGSSSQLAGEGMATAGAGKAAQLPLF